MIGATKRVLVVEDDPTTRGDLVDILRSHGFSAESAANDTETRALVNTKQGPFDVAVLDKALKESSSTGFDLGYELRDAQPDLPPEFVVHSAHSEPADYDDALKLGISDYVVKGIESDSIIDRIRLAALKAALNPARMEVGERIEHIAEEELKLAIAVRKLCAEIIKPELEVCLGVPSVFLVGDAEGTHVLNGKKQEPEFGGVYTEIQRRVIESNGYSAFTFSKNEIGVPAEAAGIVEDWEGGRFASFDLGGDVKLSLGILQPKKSDSSSREIDFRNLELETYVNPPIEQLLSYLSRIERAVEAAKRKTLLGHTSRFCLYVAQTQLEILDEVAEEKDLSASAGFQKLKKLALDLQATGNEFSLLSESIKQERTPVTTSPPISVSSVVKRAWNEIQEHFWLEKLKLTESGQDFTLAIEENDLFVAVLRVLQWLAQREDKVSTATPTIDVEYSRRNDRLEVSFTDQSRRLRGELRQKLFEPFTQIASTTKTPKDGKDDERPGLYLPLYLAKTLIETKNSGLLEDRTDELDPTSKFGHRFTISFPPRRIK